MRSSERIGRLVKSLMRASSDLTRGFVANRKYEIQVRSTRRCKLIPALTAQAIGRQTHVSQVLQSERMDLTARMASRAEADEATGSPVSDQHFRQDASGGISCA